MYHLFTFDLLLFKGIAPLASNVSSRMRVRHFLTGKTSTMNLPGLCLVVDDLCTEGASMI